MPTFFLGVDYIRSYCLIYLPYFAEYASSSLKVTLFQIDTHISPAPRSCDYKFNNLLWQSPWIEKRFKHIVTLTLSLATGIASHHSGACAFTLRGAI